MVLYEARASKYGFLLSLRIGPDEDADFGFAFLLSEERGVSGTENGITLSS